MEDILKFLKIVEERQVQKGVFFRKTYRRLNPFNPLAYVFIIISIVIWIPLYGIVSLTKELNKNPFKWK